MQKKKLALAQRFAALACRHRCRLFLTVVVVALPQKLHERLCCCCCCDGGGGFLHRRARLAGVPMKKSSGNFGGFVEIHFWILHEYRVFKMIRSDDDDDLSFRVVLNSVVLKKCIRTRWGESRFETVLHSAIHVSILRVVLDTCFFLGMDRDCIRLYRCWSCGIYRTFRCRWDNVDR